MKLSKINLSTGNWIPLTILVIGALAWLMGWFESEEDKKINSSKLDLVKWLADLYNNKNNSGIKIEPVLSSEEIAKLAMQVYNADSINDKEEQVYDAFSTISTLYDFRLFVIAFNSMGQGTLGEYLSNFLDDEENYNLIKILEKKGFYKC